MLIGTLLLDKADNYLVNGALPIRPNFDKAFLTALAVNQRLTLKGLELLPRSIIKVGSPDGEVGLLTGIKEIAEKAHLLIVSRSNTIGEGKKFRLNSFILQIKTEEVELWVRNYD